MSSNKQTKEEWAIKKTSPEDVNLSQIGNSGNTTTSSVSTAATISNKISMTTGSKNQLAILDCWERTLMCYK